MLCIKLPLSKYHIPTLEYLLDSNEGLLLNSSIIGINLELMSITLKQSFQKIQGLRIITPSVEESRGSIWTSYNSEQLETYLPESTFFKHDKFSCSKHNVLRGHGDNKSLTSILYFWIYYAGCC